MPIDKLNMGKQSGRSSRDEYTRVLNFEVVKGSAIELYKRCVHTPITVPRHCSKADRVIVAETEFTLNAHPSSLGRNELAGGNVACSNRGPALASI